MFVKQCEFSFLYSFGWTAFSRQQIFIPVTQRDAQRYST